MGAGRARYKTYFIAGQFGFLWMGPPLVCIAAAVVHCGGLWCGVGNGLPSESEEALWLVLAPIQDLGAFKYLDFFIESVGLILEGLGLGAVPRCWSLPVGISFFTFQSAGAAHRCIGKAGSRLTFRCRDLCGALSAVGGGSN